MAGELLDAIDLLEFRQEKISGLENELRACRSAPALPERGQNRSPPKIEWSLQSVKKTLLEII